MGGALKLLQIGQAVQVQQHEFNCSLILQPAGQAGPKVTEVGVDYVILEDEAEGVITRIPMHLLKAVTDSATPAAEPEPMELPAAA